MRTLILILLLFFGINTYSQSIGGTTNGAASYCSGNSASGFIGLTGFTGAIIRWEMSTDGGNTWLPISNILPNQSYFSLSNTTCYRALVQNGSFSPEYSTITCITILNTTPPEITQTSDTLISSSAVTYQWFINGNILPSETNQTLVINQNGNYSVQTSDTNGCSSFSNDFSVTNVSIKETNQTIKIICSPNPNDGNFNVNIMLNSKLSYKVKISNALGMPIITKQIYDSSMFANEFDLSEEPNGVYFLSLESSGNSKSVYRIVLNK